MKRALLSLQTIQDADGRLRSFDSLLLASIVNISTHHASQKPRANTGERPPFPPRTELALDGTE